MQENKYRLERWIIVMLFCLFALPFIGTAEDFYAEKVHAMHTPKAAQTQQAQKKSIVHRASLPEDGLANAIDGEPGEGE